MKYLDILCLLKSLLEGSVLENYHPNAPLNYAKESIDYIAIFNTPIKQLYKILAKITVLFYEPI